MRAGPEGLGLEERGDLDAGLAARGLQGGLRHEGSRLVLGSFAQGPTIEGEVTGT